MGDIPNLLDASQSPLKTYTPPKPVKNYAESSVIRARIATELIPLVQEVRDRRKGLNNLWAQLFRVWAMEHDPEDERGYVGRSDIYDPSGRKALETLVTQLVSGTFPNDENFSVAGKLPETANLAADMRGLLKQRVDTDAKVRAKAEEFYRQLVQCGNSPVKFYYDRQVVPQLRRERSLTRLVPGAIQRGEAVLYDGPVFEVIDILNFYAFPENIDGLEQAELVFEDLSISVSKLRKRIREKTYYAEDGGTKLIRQYMSGAHLSSKMEADDVKLSGQGISSPSATSAQRHGFGRVDITEIYCEFDPEADSEEAEQGAVPFLITITADGEILRAIRNPWWHQRPPYALGRMGTQKGRLYGSGAAEVIRPLNLLLNDQTNQGNDCGTYCLNPVVKSNPNVLIGALTPIEPGVQWQMLDVNAGVAFDRPPVDLIQYSSIQRTDTRAQIFEAAGSPPVLQGGSSPGRAFKTATGIGTAQQNAKVPLVEVVRRCEIDVWKPMLFFFYMLDQQFAEGAIELFSAGGRAVDPRLLAGDWVFDWLASTQLENQQLRTEQFLKATEILTAPNIQQALQAKGKMVDIEPVLRRLVVDGFGFKEFDKVVVQIPPAPPAPAAGSPPPDGGPGLSQPPVDLAQLAGENPQLDGNGEFQNMRMMANDLAGPFGRMGMMRMPMEEEDET